MALVAVDSAEMMEAEDWAEVEVALGLVEAQAVEGLVATAARGSAAAAAAAVQVAAVTVADAAVMAAAAEHRSGKYLSPTSHLGKLRTPLAASAEPQRLPRFQIAQTTQKYLCKQCRSQLQKNTSRIRMDLQSPWYFELKHFHSLRLEFEYRYRRMNLHLAGGMWQTSKTLLGSK